MIAKALYMWVTKKQQREAGWERSGLPVSQETYSHIYALGSKTVTDVEIFEVNALGSCSHVVEASECAGDLVLGRPCCRHFAPDFFYQNFGV